MTRTARGVVHVERLRDQVYDLIRESLSSGELQPGQRLVEIELAERYGVSRTPVREALFQLARSGFVDATERGYLVPIYSDRDVIDWLEVQRLLIPALADQVVRTASALQIKRLARLHELEKTAHAAGDIERFLAANHDFRNETYLVCGNKLLSRCLVMINDQFEFAHRRIHWSEESRRLSIVHDTRLLAAIAARNAAAAAAEEVAFLDRLEAHHAGHHLPCQSARAGASAVGARPPLAPHEAIVWPIQDGRVAASGSALATRPTSRCEPSQRSPAGPHLKDIRTKRETDRPELQSLEMKPEISACAGGRPLRVR